MAMTRRGFVGGTAAAAAVTRLWRTPSARADEIMPKRGRRVVVVGAGWGGATAAKYVRLLEPSVEVVLIEREAAFRSCPLSNWVIGGMRGMEDITRPYDALADRHGVTLLRDTVRAVDTGSRTVEVESGRIAYDRLVLSPGIDLQRDAVPGLEAAPEGMFTAAWKAGPETEELHRQLAAMEPGGTVVLTIPLGPFRCPPGPYERTSLIADYLARNKPGSRIVVLDANQDIVSKGPLFRKAWKELYPEIVDYRADHAVRRVEGGTRTVHTDFDSFRADVACVIPPQRAHRLAFDAGLVPEGRRWVPVDPLDFSAVEAEDVHVIGDSVDTTTVGPIPKSGFVANAMGKVAAAAVVARLAGREPEPPTLVNTCYSLVSAEEGISVTAVYRWNPESRMLDAAEGSSGVSPERSALIARNAQDWASAIWSDMLA